MASADLLLHPVRLRVVQAFLGDRVLTTAELHELLPDVPTATLYRHVATLTDAGLLTVVAERRVRGAAERTYRLVLEAASVAPADTAGMTAADHGRAFTSFVGALLADFGRYLDRGDVDPARDGVGYRQAALWLDDEEFAAFLVDLRNVVGRRLELQPDGQRRRRLVSTVLVPGD
ncbi:helix-turn-helix domain-containing protein [Modestobacter lapidis]|nr:helix-turn-helix domain-containing protein [Modestobacter lapidis]